MAGKFELKNAANGKYRFVLKAGNGQVILTSETYDDIAAAEGGIASVQKNAADDARVVRKTASNGQPYFNLTATNGQVIGTSETYTTEAGMENGISSVRTNAADAEIIDLTTA